jgi:hypothetical protein
MVPGGLGKADFPELKWIINRIFHESEVLAIKSFKNATLRYDESLRPARWVNILWAFFNYYSG